MWKSKIAVLVFVSTFTFSQEAWSLPATIDPPHDPLRQCFLNQWFGPFSSPKVPTPPECGEPNYPPDDPEEAPEAPEAPEIPQEFSRLSSLALTQDTEGGPIEADLPTALDCFNCALAICDEMWKRTDPRCKRALTNVEEALDVVLTCVGLKMGADKDGNVNVPPILQCGPWDEEDRPDPQEPSPEEPSEDSPDPEEPSPTNESPEVDLPVEPGAIVRDRPISPIP